MDIKQYYWKGILIMRIKTSKETLQLLDDLKSFLNFETNAQVIKLAISVAMSYPMTEIPSLKIKEDGFEISLNVLFGDDEDRYLFLIQEYFERDENSNIRQDILYLIEYGIQDLEYRKNMAKSDINKFMSNLLEEQCI